MEKCLPQIVLLCKVRVNLHQMGWHPAGGGGGGGTLIFSHIRMLGIFYLVQNSEFQYFFLGFQKNEYFLGV